MRLSLYNSELKRISIIDERFVSCFWSEGYNTVEDFSLELQETDEYREKVRPDCYVGRDDRNSLMVIKTVTVRDNKIIATGKQAVRVLDDVAFIGTISAGADIASAISSAYSTTHGFPLVSISGNGPDARYDHQISNKTFMHLCETMCQGSDCGFRAKRNGNGITVEFYKPAENPNLVFSRRFGNLAFEGLIRSTANLKNYAIVLGQGDGSDRIKVEVDLSNGSQHRQIIVDAKDLQKSDSETYEDYVNRLTTRGIEKLLQCSGTFECLFIPSPSDFGTRYDLGDIITVLLPEYGLKIKARISRFTEISQDNTTETTVEVGQITILR